MRYTLRLLTLEQLARAAGLVCALEMEWREAGGRYGPWPFEIGVWAGQSATPNVVGRKGDGRPDSARAKVTASKPDPDRNPWPIPLASCPWCGRKLEPDLIVAVDKFASPGGAVGRPPRRGRPRRCERLLRRPGSGAGEAADGTAPAARLRHPGRAAPDLGPARHHGRPLRDGDRGAGGARGGRTRREAEDRGPDGDRAPCGGPDTVAVRAADEPRVPAARPQSPPHVPCPEVNASRAKVFRWKHADTNADTGLATCVDGSTDTTRQLFGGTEWDIRF